MCVCERLSMSVVMVSAVCSFSTCHHCLNQNKILMRRWTVQRKFFFGWLLYNRAKPAPPSYLLTLPTFPPIPHTPATDRELKTHPLPQHPLPSQHPLHGISYEPYPRCVLSLYSFEIGCVEQSPDKCGLGVDTQNVQLKTDLETEKEAFRTVRSELEQSLKTSTTQHASLQAQHTEIQQEIEHVKAQYKKCMETNLELLEKLLQAEVHESDGVSQWCSWCVNTTSVK